MGIFDRFFRKKRQPQKIELTPTERRVKYVDLAKSLIEINDKNAIDRFEKKLNDWEETPETIVDSGEYYYDTKHQEYQSYRGDSKEISENIEWFLMIDSLHFDKKIWEFDWKEDPVNVFEAVKLLADKKGYSLPDIDLSTLGKPGYLEFFFKDLNKALKAKELSLIELDINSDSYVSALIKSENLSSIIEKANVLDQKIQAY